MRSLALLVLTLGCSGGDFTTAEGEPLPIEDSSSGGEGDMLGSGGVIGALSGTGGQLSSNGGASTGGGPSTGGQLATGGQPTAAVCGSGMCPNWHDDFSESEPPEYGQCVSDFDGVEYIFYEPYLYDNCSPTQDPSFCYDNVNPYELCP